MKVRKFVAVNFRLTNEVSDYDLKNWLQSRIYYPQEAIQNKIHGKIYLSFNYDFNTKGVTDVKVHDDIGFGCGRTALQVFKRHNKAKTQRLAWAFMIHSRTQARMHCRV